MSLKTPAQSPLDDLIGFFVTLPGEDSFRVVGECCKDRVPHQSPVYRGNVEPYAQECACCKRMLVIARSGKWPILFTGKSWDAGHRG